MKNMIIVINVTEKAFNKINSSIYGFKIKTFLWHSENKSPKPEKMTSTKMYMEKK